MNDFRSLLGFSFTMDLLNSDINDATFRIIRDTERRIVSISEKHNHNKKIEFPDIGETYKLFFDTAPKGINALREAFKEKRKSKRLSCCLTYFEEENNSILDSKYFNSALKIIEENFRKSMISPLFITLVEKWNHKHIQKIRDLIQNKRNHLNKKSHLSRSFLLNAKYFLNEKGAKNLSAEMVKANREISDVFEFLNLHISIITFEYFSDLIETYTQLIIRKKTILEYLDSILNFLSKHNDVQTNKKCLEKIINNLNENFDEEQLRMKIINFCYNHIGDPSNDAFWFPWPKANFTDKENLKNAQDILNQWLAHKFIYVFFEEIAMDNDRKEFWMQYLEYITNFKIYMNDYQRYIFSINNQDIDSNIVNSKTGNLLRGGDSNAFVLQIKDYLIVEFSKTGGACYIYHNSNNAKPKLSKRNVELEALKHYTNRNLAIRVESQSSWYYSANYSTNIEGRVMHSGDWQNKFKYWIRKYLEIDV